MGEPLLSVQLTEKAYSWRNKAAKLKGDAKAIRAKEDYGFPK